MQRVLTARCHEKRRCTIKNHMMASDDDGNAARGLDGRSLALVGVIGSHKNVRPYCGRRKSECILNLHRVCMVVTCFVI